MMVLFWYDLTLICANLETSKVCGSLRLGAKVSFSAFQDLGHHFSVEVWDNVIEFAEIALDRALDE